MKKLQWFKFTEAIKYHDGEDVYQSKCLLAYSLQDAKRKARKLCQFQDSILMVESYRPPA